MSTLTIEVPENLHQKARKVAAANNVPLDMLVTLALSQALTRLAPDPYLKQRAPGSTGKGLNEFLSQVPNTEPEEYDRRSSQ